MKNKQATFINFCKSICIRSRDPEVEATFYPPYFQCLTNIFTVKIFKLGYSLKKQPTTYNLSCF